MKHLKTFNLKQIESKVKTALQCLIKNDSFLLSNNTNERSITHKLAEYLQQEFPEQIIYNKNNIERRFSYESGKNSC